MLDRSNLSSTSKRKKGGLRDNGQLQLSFNFDPASPAHTLLRDALDTNAFLQVELAFTDAEKTCWACQAFVSAFTVSIGMDGFVEATLSSAASSSSSC